MLKLIVNPGTDQSWEIPLPPGATVLGSDPSNAFPIAHETVSPAHCQILVSGDAVTIRDLGSNCGTFVNHEQVDEARLAAGQTLTLGEVELIVASESDHGSPPPTGGGAIPIPRRIPPTGPIRVEPVGHPASSAVSTVAVACKYHPKALARWLCRTCNVNYCDLCVTVRRVEDVVCHLCRACGSECEKVELRVVPEQEEKGFFGELPGAFGYPLQGNGVILLAGGVVLLIVVRILSSMAGMVGPLGGIAALIMATFGPGYLFSYAKNIITTTAAGEAEPPDWPDYTDWWDDILAPFLQFMALILLTFGPAIILRFWRPGGEDVARYVIPAAVVFGALLAPMGMLALAMLDSVAALNPISLAWSISRIPLHYLAAAAAFELVVGAYFVVGDLFRSLVSVPILPGLLSDFLSLYLVVVGMRILGLLYRTDQEVLAWI